MRASSGSLTFTDYLYGTDLGAGANYRSAANTWFWLQPEQGLIDADLIYTEFYQAGGWQAGVSTTALQNVLIGYMDVARNSRIINGSAGALMIQLSGYVWS